MGGVKTIEQARALREERTPQYVERLVIRPDGVTVREIEYRKLVAQGIDGDDILCFIDSDGRPMRVEYTEDGPVKTLSFY